MGRYFFVQKYFQQKDKSILVRPLTNTPCRVCETTYMKLLPKSPTKTGQP